MCKVSLVKIPVVSGSELPSRLVTTQRSHSSGDILLGQERIKCIFTADHTLCLPAQG